MSICSKGKRTCCAESGNDVSANMAIMKTVDERMPNMPRAAGLFISRLRPVVTKHNSSGNCRFAATDTPTSRGANSKQVCSDPEGGEKRPPLPKKKKKEKEIENFSCFFFTNGEGFVPFPPCCFLLPPQI